MMVSFLGMDVGRVRGGGLVLGELVGGSLRRVGECGLGRMLGFMGEMGVLEEHGVLLLLFGLSLCLALVF